MIKNGKYRNYWPFDAKIITRKTIAQMKSCVIIYNVKAKKNYVISFNAKVITIKMIRQRKIFCCII